MVLQSALLVGHTKVNISRVGETYTNCPPLSSETEKKKSYNYRGWTSGDREAGIRTDWGEEDNLPSEGRVYEASLRN